MKPNNTCSRPAFLSAPSPFARPKSQSARAPHDHLSLENSSRSVPRHVPCATRRFLRVQYQALWKCGAHRIQLQLQVRQVPNQLRPKRLRECMSSSSRQRQRGGTASAALNEGSHAPARTPWHRSPTAAASRDDLSRDDTTAAALLCGGRPAGDSPSVPSHQSRANRTSLGRRRAVQ